ncbi:hypothetical protein CYMTET_33060 [Cymbomonas tetramitiformis]|uniref:Pectin acetylesterase n=1 Tax=Cymbomonas tetramitiformis TaxID=36881 RepID=A0AAE0KRL0_9CHLO|nr:hypothetical protein CYMTET_33060 [Cymbomonas tetramitiformis]
MTSNTVDVDVTLMRNVSGTLCCDSSSLSPPSRLQAFPVDANHSEWRHRVSRLQRAYLSRLAKAIDQRGAPSSTTGGDTLSLVLFNDAFSKESGARCLDGTPSGYYIRKVASNSPNEGRWIVYLQGGGLCVEPADCLQRSKSDRGSSNKWGATRTVGTNGAEDLLSASSDNPFSDWNHVFVSYASGDTWTGTRREPTLATAGLYFAGHLTLRAVVSHLKETQGLKEATHLMLSGGSAGGIGVFNNADFFVS